MLLSNDDITTFSRSPFEIKLIILLNFLIIILYFDR